MSHRLFFLYIALLLASCRGDDFLIVSEDTDLGVKTEQTDIAGMYVLNQGNMGSNKCTLDYLDLSPQNATIHYFENIFAERNPNEVKELGDVGNDIKVYGGRLWIVVNCSNKVEVCNVADTKKIGKIDIPNCRYLAFHERYAYVSSYVGPVQISGDAPLGRVYKVDTLSLQKVDSLIVGYQPDEMAVVGNRLYVANSGGYRVPNYDNRLSVIDLRTFKVVEQVEIAPNLYRCRADKYGQVWISSRGDYFGDSPALYCYTPQHSSQTSPSLLCVGEFAVSDLDIVGDSLYFVGTDFNYTNMKNELTIGVVNVRTHERINTTLFSAKEISQAEKIYGIKVSPIAKDFYLMDAKNYVSSGELLHFHSDGTFDWRVWTGDIPCAAAFVINSTHL